MFICLVISHDDAELYITLITINLLFVFCFFELFNCIIQIVSFSFRNNEHGT